MAALSQQQSVAEQFQAAIYAMVQEVVAAGGAPHSYASMLALQQTWNDNQQLLSGAGILWFHLDEDGLYGPNTGKALKLLTGVTSPAHTADIPPWYKTNKALIDSFANSGPAPQAAPPAPAAPVASGWAPTSADLAVADKLHGAVYIMAQQVTADSAGSATKGYSSILQFQQLWNTPATKATVLSFYKNKVVSYTWFKLTEDSKYGPLTARALSMTTSTVTPAKTAGLVQWYVTNKDQIDGYADAARNLIGGSAPSLIANAKVTPNPSAVAAAAQDVANSARSGSLAQQQVPNQSAQSTPQGQLVAQYSPSSVANQNQVSSAGGASIGSYNATLNQGVSQSQVTPPQAIESKMAASNDIATMASNVGASESVSFADEPVVVQAPKSNLKVIAIGAGLVAAAGVFAYMARNPSARRRFA